MSGEFRKRTAFVRKVWQAEWGLTVMLVSLVLGLFVASPLVAIEHISQVPFDVIFSVLLLSGVLTVSGGRWLVVGPVLVLVLATVAIRWAKYVAPSESLRVWEHALSILIVAIFAVLVLVLVFRDGPVTAHRIFGAIIVYLLVGVCFLHAYDLVYILRPAAFQMATKPEPSSVSHGFLYYSFVTLTTVGYGDIVPLHPVARALAVLEALIGQLYPAILIARLVSLEVSSRSRG